MSSQFIATLHSKHIFWDSWDNIFLNFSELAHAKFPPRGATDPIFSTQRIPRWADFIFLMKKRGDDATENVNFQSRKQRLQGPKNFKLNFDEFFDER